MNERLVTLLGGLAAFVAVALLLAPPASVSPGDGSVPTSVDNGPQGLAGLRQWLAQSGIPVVSLQDRYPELMTHPELPEQGNLLITVLPQRHGSRPDESAVLERWVAQGNAVLLLTALADWPAWTAATDRDVFTLPQQLGFRPLSVEETAPERKGEAAAGPAGEKRPLLPGKRVQHLHPAALPLLRGIDEVRAHWLTSEDPHWRIESAAAGPRAVLVLLKDDAGEPAFWQARVGQGRLWLSRHAELFNNAMIGQADNALFAARLVAAALGPEGRVIFDDRHHGLTRVYDPDAFYQDPRLHNTLGFLFALWIIYLLGHTNRFTAPAARRPPVSLAREVRAVGGFLARRVRPAAVARRLLEHFHNEVRGGLHLPRNGQPAWDALEGHARVSPDALRQARALAARAEAGQRVDLRGLVNTLKRIKESLQ